MIVFEKFKNSRLIIKIGLIGIAVIIALGLLLMPLLTVDAGQTATRGIEKSGLAYMERQEATGGIVLLGSVLVLIIVAGTLRVLNQDRLHRPHLLKSKRNEKKAKKETVDTEE